ncbi:MAG TPA: hypothetical protein VF669_11625 [Tepidisphaeraceae bacterium]
MPQVGQGIRVTARNAQDWNLAWVCVPTPVGEGVSQAPITSIARHVSETASAMSRPRIESCGAISRGE